MLAPLRFSSTLISQPALPVVERLNTPEQHIKLLKDAFQRATRTILITSYWINKQSFDKADLRGLIIAARRRGVKIYVYYNDLRDVDSTILDFLDEHRVLHSPLNIHSKVLSFDNSLISVGSFDWLSVIGSQYESSENSSLVCYGGLSTSQLIDIFWRYIKYYRNIQFGNLRQILEFELDPSNMMSRNFLAQYDSRLFYLSTLRQHRDFIHESFLRAKQRIIICSPFIHEECQDDINHESIRAIVNRGVHVYFICLPEQIRETGFTNFVNRINSPNVHLIEYDIHLKTFIVDDCIIAEGSFNWLRATRNERSQHHKHETTLVVKGEVAKQFIINFERSRLWQVVSQEQNQERAAKNLNRLGHR